MESSWHGRSVDHVLTYSGRQIAADLRNLHELRGKRLVAQVIKHVGSRCIREPEWFDAPLESSWHGRSVDHVLTYSDEQSWSDLKNLHELRGKDCCASESNTSVRVVFANGSGFDAPIGVVLAWEVRGSCLNIFWKTNRGQISVTFMNYEANDSLRNESNTSVRVVFANRSGFDAPIGVVLAWEERGSCLNIFRMTNRGRISETFTNYEAKDLLRSESNTSVRVVLANRSGLMLRLESSWHGRSVDHVLTYSGRQITVRSQKLHELRGKRLVAIVSQTRRFEFYSRTGVVLMLRLESSWHGRSVDHVLTYSGRQIMVGSPKSSRITRKKTCCASESNMSVRVVFANRSGFDAPIGVVLAWEERVDHVLTYSGQQITVGSQKPSRITRKKTCCASESNTSVRVVFANRSGFDAPIGVVLAWEERGSCVYIFRTTNRGRISETCTNYEAKDLLRK
ncbi:uncharacterized protein G2W53_044972 [Senna tora]|uniref:Uncharacterized protein n=1 Tax=Senna tora TaxID=362788 RepID=A0A834SC15_9FABA|nr:uncharacterized protein G2W53_044972 [Senna tora]